MVPVGGLVYYISPPTSLTEVSSCQRHLCVCNPHSAIGCQPPPSTCSCSYPPAFCCAALNARSPAAAMVSSGFW